MKKIEACIRYKADINDQYIADILRPFDDMFVDKVLQETRWSKPGTILNVGILTLTASLLANLANIEELKDWHMVGTVMNSDVSDCAQLASANEELNKRVEFLPQDNHKIDLPDCFADIIINRATFHFFSQPALFLAEIFRVLKPNGIAIIWNVRRDSPVASMEVIEEFNRLRASAGLSPFSFDNKFTLEEMKAFIDEAGLTEYSEIFAPIGKDLTAMGVMIEIIKPD